MTSTHSTDQLLYLSRRDVETICLQVDSVSLVTDVLRLHASGHTVLPDEAYLSWENPSKETVRSLNMPGYLSGDFRSAGTKIINSNPANPTRGLPRASGLTLLFDPDTTRILCVMEGAYISALRTASVSAMARLLSPQFRCMAVIGAGVIGTTHIEVAARTFPLLERVVLFDTNPTAAAGAVEHLQERLGRSPALEMADDAESAVREADVVVPATTVNAGYIPYDWLRPGALAVNVSLDDLMADALLRSDLLFVDDWNLIKADSRRLLGRLYREGRVAGPGNQSPPNGARRVDGELGDIVLGRHPGRQSAAQIIVVNPFGLAIEDVAFASRIFAVAQSGGLGTRLPV
jgi:ornithine cyclodeaminase/alanine dehydrogenase-like protein (mu-crystallin family)